jgi:glycosyltransferase involved in cell wall biosynthesis
MNKPWYLNTQLQSTAKHADTRIEILVYSSRHTVATDHVVSACSATFPDTRIELVEAVDRNAGVSVAVNTLARAAKADYLFYTADDNYMLPGWDTALLQRILPDHPWQYLTARLIEPSGNNPNMYAPHNFGRTPSDFRPADLHAFWGGLEKRDCISCAGPPFMSKDLWDRIGGFDEGYYPGFGTDQDVTATIHHRAKEDGWKPMFLGVGDSGMYHFQRITTNTVGTPELSLRAKARFQEKWGMTTQEFRELTNDGQIIY